MAKVDITRLTPDGKTFGATQTISPYVEDDDRFVVTFAIGFKTNDEVMTVEDAAAWALAFTRNANSDDAMWVVHDRQDNKVFIVEQQDSEDAINERDMLR